MRSPDNFARDVSFWYLTSGGRCLAYVRFWKTPPALREGSGAKDPTVGCNPRTEATHEAA